jgi:hypothetical protein
MAEPKQYDPAVVGEASRLQAEADALHRLADDEKDQRRRQELRHDAVRLEKRADGLVPVEHRSSGTQVPR